MSVTRFELPEECLYEMDVEVPWELVDEQRQAFVRQIASSASAPGFRRGRVPAPVLARRYEHEFVEWLKEGFVPRYLVYEVQKRDVQVASDPLLGEVEFAEGRPMRVQGAFEVFPKFEIGEYRGLALTKRDYEVTDEIVDRQLEELRLRQASYLNLDPRPIQDGDIAVLSFVGSLDGETVSQEDEMQFEVGSDRALPEFSDALRGSTPGDQLAFQVTFPDEEAGGRLAGRTVDYRVAVHRLQRRELPDLDDEFAKDLDNEADSLEAFRARLREQLESRAREAERSSAENEALRILAEAHPMPLPTLYVHARIQAAWEEIKRESKLDKDVKLRGSFADQLAEIVTGRIRGELVLERIATLEGISVSKEEIEQAVLQYAQAQQMTPERAGRELSENGTLAQWRISQMRGKALQFLLDEAAYIDPDDGDEESANAPAEPLDAAEPESERGAE